MANENAVVALEKVRQSIMSIMGSIEMAYADGKLQVYEIPMIIAAVSAQAYPLVQAFRGLSGSDFDDVMAAIRAIRFEVVDDQ